MTHSPDDEQAEKWVTWSASNLYLALVAGLLVAAIVAVEETTARLLYATTGLLVASLIFSSVALWKRTKSLARELRAVRDQQGDKDVEFAGRLRRVGITEITERMTNSRFSPDAVMARAQHQVRFLGVFAHKWVMDAQRKDAMRAMLTRVQLNGGRVQFLLLDPDSAAAQRLAMFRMQEANHYKGFSSIAYLSQLQNEFDCFEYRLFTHFPFLRLSFVDGDCALSRFKVHAGAEETLNAAQIVFAPEEPNGNWTLHQGFMLLFDHLWANARESFQDAPRGAEPAPRRLSESTGPLSVARPAQPETLALPGNSHRP